ncbi:hypothetical protein V5N11_035933 [Cardamine amara subsp. amara]|uniref:Uncharacterized protein n=1 Tax=Cardamine amara subsp. amara TaxID=228776 RepID=A0ABD1C4T8_CARAN
MNQNDIMNRMVQDAEKKIEKVQFHKRSMDLGLIAMFKDLSTDADYSEELNKAAEVFEKKFKVVRERIKAVKAGTPIIKRD